MFVMSGFGSSSRSSACSTRNAQHGPIFAAATQNIIIILMLCFTAFMAYGTATATLVGQSMGAKEYDLAERYGWEAVKIGVYITLVHRLGVMLLPRHRAARLHQGRGGDRGGAADPAHLRRAACRSCSRRWC